MADISEAEIIKKCLKGERTFQKILYELYERKMIVVCCLYTDRREEAEDIHQEAFITVFEKLNQYKGEGSLEGWIRRIMVNKAIDHFRKKSKMYVMVNLDNEIDEFISSDDILSNISSKDLLKMIQELPPTYRMIFNLYAIEGLKHKEIAKKLGISEGTSRSNLSDARTILKRKVKQMMGIAKPIENVV